MEHIPGSSVVVLQQAPARIETKNQYARSSARTGPPNYSNYSSEFGPATAAAAIFYDDFQLFRNDLRKLTQVVQLCSRAPASHGIRRAAQTMMSSRLHLQAAALLT